MLDFPRMYHALRRDKNESASVEDFSSSLTSVIRTVKGSDNPCAMASKHIFYKIYRFLTLPNIRERVRKSMSRPDMPCNSWVDT